MCASLMAAPSVNPDQKGSARPAAMSATAQVVTIAMRITSACASATLCASSTARVKEWGLDIAQHNAE